VAKKYNSGRATKMKRVIIICEGQTEKEFCCDVLAPYFSKKHIYIETPLIRKSGGGIVPWEILKKQIQTHLKQDKVAFVTTLIDYYGIEKKHNYPNWEEVQKKRNKATRIDIIENEMLDSIIEDLKYRFIPYIQLHEFESLLFNDVSIFTNNFTESEFENFAEFATIFTQFPNPEDINDGSDSAPSKRLSYHIKGYNKVVYGAAIASEIGLTRIKEKCPRFNNWITKIEEL
jgi:hypothetical protein